ncbi:MAG: hypothetical protein LLG01_00035 [Planctomycetaceae bacterium]|nr:hypothetical protein [Planctomycetaceae bacterium]
MLKQKGLYNTRSTEGYEFKRMTLFRCQYREGDKTLNVGTDFLNFGDGTGGVMFYIKKLAWLSPHDTSPLEGNELHRIQENIKKVVESWNVTNAKFDTD